MQSVAHPSTYSAELTEVGTTTVTTKASHKWRNAFLRVLPLYIAIHIAIACLNLFASLFKLHDFTDEAFPILHTLLFSWYHWDSGHYTGLVTHGYYTFYSTAFFPLFPMLTWCVTQVVHQPLLAGLIVSNVAMLGMFVVFYRLVEEDFDSDRAYRSVLCIAVFPTALFFAACYTESLFLFLTLLSFYNIRRGNWWLAGAAGFFAAATRSVGVFLLLPFFYEYAQQQHWNIRNLRFNILSSLLIPLAPALYSLYCYKRYHDPLSFVHAQVHWNHYQAPPWHGIIATIQLIFTRPLLNVNALHNVIELAISILFISLLILGAVGPWKFTRQQWSYIIFTIPLYIFLQLSPVGGNVPLVSNSRYMLALFPAFITLAAMARNRQFMLYYLAVCIPMQTMMLLLFLVGHWMV